MKKIYKFSLLIFSILLLKSLPAQVTLSESPYTENFDGIGTQLPDGFNLYTGATATQMGMVLPSFNTAAFAWNNTSGAFKNFASASVGEGTSSGDQGAAADRALGIRQTGALGDPGAAFVFQIANTTGKSEFKLTFDLQSLDANSPRVTTWTVQYGLGYAPDEFADADNISGTLTTGGTTFSNNEISVDFGNTLDNQDEAITIRIITLSGTTGSGARSSTAIDNFNLSWIDENSNIPQLFVTDASDNPISSLVFSPLKINTSSTLSYILSSKNLTDNVTIGVTGTGFTISSDNIVFGSSLGLAPEDAADKTIYIRLSPVDAGAYSGSVTNQSTGAYTKTISLTGQAFDPAHYNFDFNACANNGEPGSGFTQFSVTGDQVWTCTNFGRENTSGVNINGFSSGANENEDWLISPLLDLSLYTDIPVLSFWSRGEFDGPSLTLWASTDYNGTGNPNDFTWVQIDANFPPLNNTWTLSDGINLHAYKSAPVYIAFKYVSNPNDGAARWTLDDVDVENRTQLFSATPAIAYFGEQAVGTQSSGQPVHVQAIGYGDVTVTATEGYQVSTDDNNYSNSVMLQEAAAQDGTGIFVRFAPTSKQLIVSGSLHFGNGNDLDVEGVILTGSSYPKSETFDAGAYNLSFFGSSGASTIVRTPEQIQAQISNIATVFSHLDLDVTGFEEMSDNNSLNEMVNELNAMSGKTYSAVVSGQYYSHSFDAPDPDFPPQKLGVLYNTATMTVSTTEPPRAMFSDLYDNILAENTTLTGYPGGNSSSFWASGRLPFMVTFDVNIEGVRKKVRIIVIHAKSGADIDSYNRRVYDAQVLKDSLDTYYSGDNVIIVGDYNDRVVTSITSGQASPYQPFITGNPASYDILTMPLDAAGQTSFPGDAGMIDQIMITGLLIPGYLANSTVIEPANTYISPYNKVVGSDHLPVYSRFDFAKALPVTLVNFTGRVVDDHIQLNWETASEINSKLFIVQHSVDGNHFGVAGSTVAQGTTSLASRYLLNDYKPAEGPNFYRLIQEDVDGHSTVLQTIRVNYTSSRANNLVVYPNPITGNNRITLKLTSATGVYTATVYSLNGKISAQVRGTIDQINQQLNKEFDRLVPGVYLLQLGNNTDRYQAKLIRQ